MVACCQTGAPRVLYGHTRDLALTKGGVQQNIQLGTVDTNRNQVCHRRSSLASNFS